MKNIRNVAIVAHVDHGKTTLVDALLKQTQTKLHKDIADTILIMDSNELEKERGITIFSKNASVSYKGTKINIIDTPGHADFGGEVERVLKLADGCLLLIDAKEGPMPQTRFVLKQALKMGLKIIVVINKIDRPDARIEYVVNKTFDLFIELGADEESAYFPTIYASAKKGLAGEEKNLENMTDIIPIFEAILKHIPEPGGDETKPLQMLVTSVTSDNFKGRVATGRIFEGRLNKNQDVIHISREGNKSKCRLTSLMSFVGLEKQEENEAVAGDIVAISGIPNITIGETITDNMDTSALPLLSIEEPTVKMTFGVNTSTFAGKEGEFKTSRQIEERLMKAAEDDVALKVENASGGWVVSGRGELHLTILIERLRREGFEFQVSRPVVIEKDVDGKILTPYEKVYIEVPEEFQGIVMQKMGLRHGRLQDMNSLDGTVTMEFIITTKELFGYRSEFITDTKGMGILNTNFLEFGQNLEKGFERDNGSLVVHENGVTKLYALIGAQGRGTLFIGPGISVYKGQVIGMNSRSEDISVNVCKEKSQTNHRSSGEGTSEHFNSPKFMSLEEAVEYINDEELVEITPKNIRIRKANLT
ncbi:GTP-binding protein TypA [Candidatus Daviesbacteria bacterium RIFCSPHIGHO2_01_FULL_37_27]|nr:MAG: GTP-binding protein TypA [Candidatus Daviesbacteria bacterium RIFCSPHIGHO2_01_FULL_37_27]OGE44814.1 MAG: GTP-binding protein TypA [Candidatus Daviesbacteria bacterium RIFCSPLOWO2_01_FULL_37_10]